MSPSPVAAALVRCEDLPDRTYTSDTFRFTIGCPGNFSWQVYSPGRGRLFHARAVDDKYLRFDFVYVGPDGPPSFQAAAFVLPEGSVLLLAWWAYSGDYRPTIASVAQQMIASIQPFGA